MKIIEILFEKLKKGLKSKNTSHAKMDYKSVDKAYRWPRSDVYLEGCLKRVAESKRRLEQAKNNISAYLKKLQSYEDWDNLTPM